jgi:hypothetical protein
MDMTDKEFEILMILTMAGFAILYYMVWNVLRILYAMGTDGRLKSFDKKAIWNVLRILVARAKDGQFKRFPMAQRETDEPGSAGRP